MLEGYQTYMRQNSPLCERTCNSFGPALDNRLLLQVDDFPQDGTL